MARRQKDAYYTPHWATAALLRTFPQIKGKLLCDPSCGDGRMEKQLVDAGRFERVRLNDVDDSALPRAAAGLGPQQIAGTSLRDACDPAIWTPRPDWSVTNPPFNVAGDIARCALEHSTRGVALLVRCTWLEPCGPSHVCRKATADKPAIPCSKDICLRNGREWLKERPPAAILVLPRFSFTGAGSDSAAAWWVVWSKEVPRGVYYADEESLQQDLLIGAQTTERKPKKKRKAEPSKQVVLL